MYLSLSKEKSNLINDLLKQVNVVYSGPKEAKHSNCHHCNKPKLKHTDEQTYKCKEAMYYRA